MNNLQKLRKEKNLSQSKFAKASGINFRTLQRYELITNKDLANVNVSTILKICVALNCTVGDLLDTDEARAYDEIKSH